MKTFYAIFICTAVFLGASCGKVVPDGGLDLKIPKLPLHWEQIAGPAHWRVEYVDAGGKKAVRNLQPGEQAVIELLQTWNSAVLVWPYWPEQELRAGTFKPAGALYPYDATVFPNGEGSIHASWNAGVDAFLYWELAAAAAAEPAALYAKIPRLPSNFNWPRFRALMAGEELAEEIRFDPWLVDWRSFAEQTARKGFDRRRIKAQAEQKQTLPLPAAIWAGTSPFAIPLDFESGQAPVFPVREETELWLSAAGILRANKHAWLFIPSSK